MSRLYFLGVLVALPVAWAQEIPSDAPPITLLRAASLTLEKSPRLRSVPFSREAAAADIDLASLTPPWSVDLKVEDFAGTGELSGFGASETTLQLSRIFESSGVRAGRKSVASASARQVDSELEIERLDTMTLVAQRFLAVVRQQEMLDLAKQSISVWERAGSLAQQRENAGGAPAIERLRTEIQLENARLQLEHAEHELQATRIALAATWGDAAANFGRAEAQLCTLPDLVPFAVAAERLDQNPDLLRFVSAQQLHATRIQLADARRRPDWTLSAGIKRVEMLNDQALVLSVSVPLGSSSRAAPSSRRENALRQQSELEEQATRLDFRAALYDVYQELLHTRTALQAFEEEILPRASRIVADIEDGYRMGRFLQIELLNAHAELLAARAARIDVCNDNQRFLIEIERLTGGGPVWLAEPAGVAP